MERDDSDVTQAGRFGRLSDSLQMLNALAYPQYRRYWFGNLAAVSGQQMMWVAQGWLVYRLTDSPLYLGYAGLASALPAIFLNLIGGVFADRLDQRRVILATQAIIAVAVAALATLIALDLVRVWHVLTVAFISGATQAFNNPARQSIFPQLVDRKDLMNAVSLNSIVWQGTRVVAPSAGGLIVAALGEAVTFYIVAATMMVLGVVVIGLKVERQARRRDRAILSDLGEGLSFISHNFLFAFLIGMSFFSSFFGMSVHQLIPVFARDILAVGPAGMGLLLSLSGVGSVLGVFLIGILGGYDRKGMLIIGGATAYGFCIMLFAVSSVYLLSATAMFFLGVFSSVYMITMQTTLQLRVPDELRGRVMGVYGMTHNIGPLGALQAGVIAAAFSAPLAVAIGGCAIVFFALSAALTRTELRRLQAAPAAG